MSGRIIVLFVAISLALSAGPLLAEDRDDETVLREIKEVLWPQAYATQDVELLDTILADEFQLVDAGGNRTTKADELAWLRANAPNYDSLVFSILRLDIFENGTAVVGGVGTISGSDEQGAYILEYQSTNVLIKRGDAWKAVASHVSGITRKDA